MTQAQLIEQYRKAYARANGAVEADKLYVVGMRGGWIRVGVEALRPAEVRERMAELNRRADRAQRAGSRAIKHVIKTIEADRRKHEAESKARPERPDDDDPFEGFAHAGNLHDQLSLLRAKLPRSCHWQLDEFGKLLTLAVTLVDCDSADMEEAQSALESFLR